MIPISALSLATKSLHVIVDRSIFSAAAGKARARAATTRAARRNMGFPSFRFGTGCGDYTGPHRGATKTDCAGGGDDGNKCSIRKRQRLRCLSNKALYFF